MFIFKILIEVLGGVQMWVVLKGLQVVLVYSQGIVGLFMFFEYFYFYLQFLVVSWLIIFELLFVFYFVLGYKFSCFLNILIRMIYRFFLFDRFNIEFMSIWFQFVFFLGSFSCQNVFFLFGYLG